jgi:NADP-dependent 3-hydroxy acid dehydrogenase YdfG
MKNIIFVTGASSGFAQDGCEEVNAIADHIRAEFLRRIGLDDLLTPRVND